VSKQLWSNPK